MNSRLSCNLPNRKIETKSGSQRTEGEERKTEKVKYGNRLKEGDSVCAHAYVLRLPYTLLPVLAVNTLLSIS